MSIAKSEFAVSELAHLDAVAPEASVVLSFEEGQSIRIASWAVARFGSDVLLQRVIGQYNKAPHLVDGKPVSIFDSGLPKWQYAMDDAEAIGIDVSKDLIGAARRLDRGYPLGSFTVRGVVDTAAVIGSLERAVEINTENLSSDEQYKQAAARYMLDHMQVTDSKIDQSVSYLI